MATTGRREFLISKVWLQAAVLVVLVGFFVLGLLAYRTYMEQPPVPDRVVDARGELLFSGSDISEGQQVFLHNGLMEYGSVFGHGAYLGPDFTADYLRRAVGPRHARPTAAPAPIAPRRADDRGLPHQPLRQARPGPLDADRRAGRGASARLDRATTARFFSDPTTKHGLRPQGDHRPHRSCGS